MEGKLYSSVDHESCTWIIREDKRYSIYVLGFLSMGTDFKTYTMSDFWPFWDGLI